MLFGAMPILIFRLRAIMTVTAKQIWRFIVMAQLLEPKAFSIFFVLLIIQPLLPISDLTEISRSVVIMTVTVSPIWQLSETAQRLPAKLSGGSDEAPIL